MRLWHAGKFFFKLLSELAPFILTAFSKRYSLVVQSLCAEIAFPCQTEAAVSGVGGRQLFEQHIRMLQTIEIAAGAWVGRIFTLLRS